jgi:Spy/CpxP family protein refolding chaperone
MEHHRLMHVPRIRNVVIGLGASWMAVGALAWAEDPAPVPRTHVDSTVVGDARDDTPPDESKGLDNDHNFEAGAPRLSELSTLLNLSSQQKVQLNDAIERADAGAAVLIKREQHVKEMLAKTTPADPLYAQLQSEQARAPSLWQEGRTKFRQEVRSILTPAQQAKFDQLRAQQAPASTPADSPKSDSPK